MANTKKNQKFKITCDYCKQEIEIGNGSGLVAWDIDFDDTGRKTITNVGIYHKNLGDKYCDRRRDANWKNIDDLVGADGLYIWLDMLDPKYNHGENNKDAQYTTIDLSFVEAMYRCLCPGYDEARHYAKTYAREVLGLPYERIVTRQNIEDILKWINE